MSSMEPLIFSLDPGVAKMGWALTTQDGDTEDYGFFSDQQGSKVPFNKRMNKLIYVLLSYFDELLDKRVGRVVWEIVPSFAQMRNKDLVQATCTTLKVRTFQRDLEFQEFTPQYWHKKLLGKSSCTKEEVKQKVLQYGKIPEDLSYDVYDAIAIGRVASQVSNWERFSDIP